MQTLSAREVGRYGWKVETEDPTGKLFEPEDIETGRKLPARPLFPDRGWNRRPEEINLKDLLAGRKMKLGIPAIEEAAAWRPATTIEEAEKFATMRFEAKEVNFRGIQLNSANAINEELTNLFDSFPQMRGKIGYIGTDLEYTDKYMRAPRMRGQVLAYTTEGSLVPDLAYQSGYSDIVFNSYRWGDFEAIKNDVRGLFERKWLINGELPAVVDHEFGHALYNAQAKLLAGAKRQGWIETAYADYKARGIICENLSRYADGDGMAEFWAEWFSGYRSQKLSAELMETIEGILKYEPFGG